MSAKSTSNDSLPRAHAVNLLRCMKLDPELDFKNYTALCRWVNENQTCDPESVSIVTQAAASLLLIRVTRAFQQRVQNKNIRPATDLAQISEFSKKKATPTNTNQGKDGLGSSVTDPVLAAISQTQKTEKSKTESNSFNLNGAAPLDGKETRLPRKVKVSPGVMRALMFVGSDLKNLLHSISTAESTSTVAEVAEYCLKILDVESSDNERIRSFFQRTFDLQQHNSDDEELSIFKTFCQQTFQAIQSQAIAATETSFDFEFLHDKACENPSLRHIFHGMEESRQAAWKISRYWALRQRFEHFPRSESPIMRRTHVLGMATSLVWMAALGKLVLGSLKTTEAHFDRAPLDEARYNREGPEQQRANPSGKDPLSGTTNIEDEGKPSPPKRQRVATILNETESPPNHNEDEDLVGVILDVANMLFAFLAWASPNHQDICALSRHELERQVLILGADICSLQLLRQAPPDADQNQKRTEPAFVRAMRNAVPKMRFMAYNYKAVVDNLVLNTQQLFNPNMVKPIPMASVLFLAPTVIGEPWGIPKVSPKDETRFLCRHITSRPVGEENGGITVVVAGDSGLMFSNNSMKPPPGVTTPTSKEQEASASASPPPLIPTATLTDSMELNEWTLSVLSLSIVKPSENLQVLLSSRHDNGSPFLRNVITPVLNRAMSRVQRNNISGESKLSVGTGDGLVYISGNVTDDVHLCAAIIGLYYHALELILRDDAPVARSSFLKTPHFHTALLACCQSCMLKAIGNYPNMMQLSPSFEHCTIYTILDTVECSAYTFLKVAEPFCRALTAKLPPWKVSQRQNGSSPLVFRLPRILQNHMNRTEVQVLDSVIWLKNSCRHPNEEVFAETVEKLRQHPDAWPPEVLEAVLPEEMEDAGLTSGVQEIALNKSPFSSTSESQFLSYLLRKLLKVSYYRIQAICNTLALPVDPVASQVLVAFRYLLRNAVELLYNRHVDQLIICTIYGVCKVMKVSPALSFERVTMAYMAVRGDELGEKTCQLIVRRVNLLQEGDSNLNTTQSRAGDVISFYNLLFVPKMRKHFLKSKSLKRSAYQLEILRLASVPRVVVPPGSHLNMPPPRKGSCQVR